MPDATSQHTKSDRLGSALETAAAPTGLTSAATAVYTELTKLDHNGATATEISLAAHVGRSTAGKVLVALEQRGLATRSPGGHDGARRLADLWHPTHDRPNSEEGLGSERSAGSTTAPEPSTMESSKRSREARGHREPTDAMATEEDSTGLPATEASDAAPAAEPPDGEDGTSEQDSSTTPDSTNALVGQRGAEQPVAPAEAITLPSSKQRLAPGGLRQMVLEHLQAHPDQAFTATRISRLIDRSSGAIANALDKLAHHGLAELVSEQPRTYRLPTVEYGPK